MVDIAAKTTFEALERFPAATLSSLLNSSKGQCQIMGDCVEWRCFLWL